MFEMAGGTAGAVLMTKDRQMLCTIPEGQRVPALLQTYGAVLSRIGNKSAQGQAARLPTCSVITAERP